MPALGWDGTENAGGSSDLRPTPIHPFNSFLADAYDIFVINIALMMMKQVDYGVPLTHDTQRWVSLTQPEGRGTDRGVHRSTRN